jgi:nanoRNase/pAp phosphatase (c-di-AMP/oligoRNAs hydrolase)
MNDSLKSLIDSSKSVVVLLPQEPDLDQVASGLSLFLSLKESKEVSIYCPSAMVVEFNKLIGVDKISTEIGNKNMVVKFPGYLPEDIERVSYDIDKGEFALTIIPKPGKEPPQKEQLKVSYSGISADLIIMIGGKEGSQFPILASKEIEQAKIAHIGINEVKIENREIISFATSSSSICEVVAGFIDKFQGRFGEDIATNLISGLYEGSRGFASEFVTAETFSLAAKLMQAGGKRIQKDEAKVNFPSAPTAPAVASSTPQPPRSWLGPKIYKGTSIN